MKWKSSACLWCIGIALLAASGLSCTDSVETIPPSPLNLGFEVSDGHDLPFNWYAGGSSPNETDYTANLDDSIKHSGLYSLHLKYVTGDGFGLGTNENQIVNSVRGTTVRYSGWIKTNNVSGYAGLWWRVDAENGNVLAFNNMYDSSIYGTRDWQQYSFEIPVSDTAFDVAFGVLMSGTGEAWFDDLAIDTNGHPFAR